MCYYSLVIGIKLKFCSALRRLCITDLGEVYLYGNVYCRTTRSSLTWKCVWLNYKQTNKSCSFLSSSSSPFFFFFFFERGGVVQVTKRPGALLTPVRLRVRQGTFLPKSVFKADSHMVLLFPREQWYASASVGAYWQLYH